jgi:hypothetical protein
MMSVLKDNMIDRIRRQLITFRSAISESIKPYSNHYTEMQLCLTQLTPPDVSSWRRTLERA